MIAETPLHEMSVKRARDKASPTKRGALGNLGRGMSHPRICFMGRAFAPC